MLHVAICKQSYLLTLHIKHKSISGRFTTLGHLCQPSAGHREAALFAVTFHFTDVLPQMTELVVKKSKNLWDSHMLTSPRKFS